MLLVVAEDWKSPMAIVEDWVDKPGYIHMMEYYVAGKRRVFLCCVITRKYRYV